MEPVNSKSMLAFLYNQMEKLDKGEITAQEGAAQAMLASQATNLLRYELQRVKTEIEVSKFKHSIDNSNIRLREIESKGFDDKLLQVKDNE
jgi:hypothetical protein